MSLFAELKRRNVFRVGVLYVVTAWLVIQVAETLLPIFDVPEWLLRAVVLLLVVGFIPAVIFSWVYELTPEGIKRESEVERSTSITRQTARRLDVFTIVVVVVGIAFAVTDRWLLDDGVKVAEGVDATEQGEGGSEGDRAASGSVPGRATADEKGGVALRPSSPSDDDGLKSVAVLPFVNMSAEVENEYFSDGISEELLNVLVKIKGLRVSSRTSAFSFKGKDVDIPTVAKTLNVQHVVEGSVRRSGDQVRITAQLIDVDTDSHLWSDTYTRTMDDIFAIQDEIARAIAVALEVELLGNAGQVVETHATEDVDAFEKYLLGRFHFHQRTSESLSRAIQLFEEVVALDPQFAAAYSGLADAYNLIWQYGNYDLNEASQRAQGYAEVALSLDPNLAEAHASKGLAMAIARMGKAEATAAFERAIELNPNYSMAYVWLGNGQVSEDLEVALQTFLAGERVDPLHPIFAENISDVLMKMGRYDEAERRLLRAVEASPESWLVSNRLAELHRQKGDLALAHQRAVADFERYPDVTPVLVTLATLELELGRMEAASAAIRHFEETLPDSLAGQYLRVIRLAHEGRYEDVVAVAERNLETGPALLTNGMHRTAANFSLRLERVEQARRHLESINIEVSRRKGAVDTEMLTALAAARESPEQAREPAERVLQRTKDARAVGYRESWMPLAEAVALSLLDRTVEAEERVEQAYDLGYRLQPFDGYEFWLDRLLADSDRYQAIKRSIRSDIERELVLIEQGIDS